MNKVKDLHIEWTRSFDDVVDRPAGRLLDAGGRGAVDAGGADGGRVTRSDVQQALAVGGSCVIAVAGHDDLSRPNYAETNKQTNKRAR